MNRLPDGGYADYLARSAVRWPARIGLRFEGTDWTYQALQDAVETAANRLAASGIRRGQRVALLIDNSPDYLIAQFALARLGAVFVTPNPYWTVPELDQALHASATTAAVFADRFGDVVARLSPAVPVAQLRIPAPPQPAAEPAGGAPLYIPFSSGTTGLPKGVVHTVGSLCGGVEQLVHHLGLTAEDRLQIALPLCHIFGATMCAAALSVGAQMTLFRRFDLDEALQHITTAGVTVWPLAGTVAHQLAMRDDLRPQDFASLRYFMWGGSAVPLDLAERITERTGVRFLCSYGMTEAMMVAFNPVGEPRQWRLDSPGYPTLGTEVRVTATGELEVRGPSVAAGYVGSDSADFLPDGWFRTGDLAAVATDGRVRIIDRAKDMLKVAGFQVSPTEVEDVLRAHPDVDDVAVVGRPDDRTGQAVVAFVVGPQGLGADTLRAWVRTRLASYKRPSEYRFSTDLPRTAGGKVRRSELRARLTGHAGRG